MDSSYLISHAIKNIWCAPDQDFQYILELHRITKLTGDSNRVYLYNRRIDLPELNKKFHVFTIDRVHPKHIKILTNALHWEHERWFNTSDAINDTSCIINIYNDTGIELPKIQSWYMYTKENTLIFAFEENKKIPINYRSEIVYVKTYTNAFYSSSRDTTEIDTAHRHKTIATTEDILDIQIEYNNFASREGHVQCFINGIYTNKIDLIRVAIGDIVEFIYDSSVIIVDKYSVESLDTFTSELDNTYKYLLLRKDDRQGIIDYLDDLDIHIVAKIDNDIYKGVYFHRNNVQSIRMVTHRDYSIIVDNVVNMSNKIKELLNRYDLSNLDIYIELKVRHSGFDRPLIYENNRLHELYKLSYEDRFMAMLGANALGLWKAENLEKSWYNHLMNNRLNNFTLSDVEKAYGYNGLSIVLADTPQYTYLDSGRQVIDLPPALTKNSTFYEYDSNGLLLDKYYQASGNRYLAVNEETRLIEGIYGKGSNKPDSRFGVSNIPIPTDHNYRVYRCFTANGVPDENWLDVTNTVFYNIEDNKIINNDLIGNEYFMVRTDSEFLTIHKNILSDQGLLYIDLIEQQIREDGYTRNHPMPIPMGQLDVFLNNKSLIRGLDYIVDFPRIYIVNKKYLIQPADITLQDIKIRFTGFCDEDLIMDVIEETGFIEHGFLSNNNRFDIHDDKVMRITVDGSIKTKNDILFSENHSGISIINAVNGKPYQIKDIVVPINTFTVDNVYNMRNDSMDIDSVVSDYMSLKLPQPERDGLSAITERYPLVSTMFSKIIHDMHNNIITDIQLSVLNNDMDILNFFNSYEFLLDIDPLTKNHDSRYVIVHPHQLTNTINLSILKIRVLNRVIKLYADGKIELSPFITL